MVTEKIRMKDWLRSGRKDMSVSEDYTYPELPVAGPVPVEAHLRLNTTGVTVWGSYRANVEEPCDRCYEPFERHLSNSFEERYVFDTYAEPHPGSEVELQSEDFFETLSPDGELDLRDLVYQHLVMAIGNDRVCERETCAINE